ncbi:hypothetical protein AVEN_238477-1 [Araneus ventricosus]|uniref:Reverse transcriptase domain-containing protein n=1 Tax=Araneus ventricosus TaxID=182803 RepID=A0A4Y2SKA0_ARAVE|nr:hypothetical protein AVEN_238477-1 [Araneus ventricosus]
MNNLRRVTASEVIDFIKTLKPNKSPGLDQISDGMLKNLLLRFILYLTFLLNVLMQNCYYRIAGKPLWWSLFQNQILICLNLKIIVQSHCLILELSVRISASQMPESISRR